MEWIKKGKEYYTTDFRYKINKLDNRFMARKEKIYFSDNRKEYVFIHSAETLREAKQWCEWQEDENKNERFRTIN